MSHISITSLSFAANFAISSIASSLQTVESTSKHTASEPRNMARIRLSFEGIDIFLLFDDKFVENLNNFLLSPEFKISVKYLERLEIIERIGQSIE